MTEPEEVLDLRGVKCPLPALLTRRHLAAAPAGSVIHVLTDDPMAAIDVPHMCRNEGFETMTVERSGDETRMTLRKP